MIKISDSLALPLAFVTDTQAILAQRGKGKSYTASVEAEELLEADQQTVVLDPTGAWYGLRSSPNGRSTGYAIAVLGGEHGDLPLEHTAGEVIGSAIATEHFSAVIDLSLFRKGQANRFVGDLLETLYRKNRTPLHLFIDEADLFAPQKPFGDEARTLGAVEDIVRRGRIRGIGCTLITQRAAVLSKNVLSQADMLTLLGMHHPRDLAAVEEWVAVHGDPKKAEKLIADLPSLPLGEAWFWNPSREIFKRARVRDRHTFDSGRTPKAGERVTAPKVLAPVDLKRLGAAIADTVERAKQDDPKALRARIAELERAIAKGATKTVDKPAISKAQVAAFERAIERGCKAMDAGKLIGADAVEAMGKAVASMEKSAAMIIEATARIALQLPTIRSALQLGSPPSLKIDYAARARSAIIHGSAPPTTVRRAPRATTSRGDADMSRMERAMLVALAQHPSGLTRRKLRVHTGYADSGPVSRAFARLLALSWAVSSDDRLRITDAGLAALGEWEPLPTGDALRLSLLHGTKLSKMEKAILEAVCNAHPNSIGRSAIREAAGYADSGPVSRAFAKLVAMDYIQPQGRDLVAAEELFGD